EDGSGSGIFARRYDSAGDAVGNEFRINSTTHGDQTLPAVGADGSGGFTVAWTADDADERGVFAQRGTETVPPPSLCSASPAASGSDAPHATGDRAARQQQHCDVLDGDVQRRTSRQERRRSVQSCDRALIFSPMLKVRSSRLAIVELF